MILHLLFPAVAFGAFLLSGTLRPTYGFTREHYGGVLAPVYSQALKDARNNKCVSSLGPIDTSNITFKLYTPFNPNQPYFLKTRNTQILQDTPMNWMLPTKVIVHAWLESASSSQIKALRKAYLKDGFHNVIVVNWYPLSMEPYTIGVQIARVVAKLLGEFLDSISTTLPISLSNFHLIGHGLGAHIAGLSTQYISKRVGRITGLDPASPCFEYPVLVNKLNRLDTSDAVFVDVVHTAGGPVGFQRAIGHIDFYPNGGSYPQPQCSRFDPFCSYTKALDFWIDSVIYPNEFVGVKCDSWDNYKVGKCSCNPTAIMGELTSYLSRGDYYLVTASESPYGTV